MSNKSNTSSYLLTAAILVAIFIVFFAIPRNEVPSAVAAVATRDRSSLEEKVEFHELEAQMREFMGYDRTIQLTADQEAIKEEVLGDQPAVCCRNSTALTCCCPCNLSKSLWGLANYLIAKKGMKGQELNARLDEWIAFTNPSGYTGDACYTGGCDRSPRENGCGGMDEGRIVV